MDTVWDIALVIAAYALGAVPWGVVLGRIFAHTDIRQYGSKSIGATNALRVLGRKFSIAVLILDLLKGVLPVVIGRMAGLPDWSIGLAALVAVVGHCWSPYIGFTGGKGMATGGGAGVALFPWLLLLVPVIVVVVLVTRYVSLGSIVTVALASIAAVVTAATGHLPWSWAIAIVLMSAIIVQRHHANIARLRAGTENKFGSRVRPEATRPIS
ncbi:MAG: glycerol-3-phosphate 1-O-acyltransferase PlsY [Thermomicrobiales bacterium]